MMVGGISTVLINGNPLLKFDGYFVMTDVLGLPNLAQRANRAWGDWTNRVLFGARDVRPKSATLFERVAFAIYAPAAFVYRIILSITIGLYVASTFFVLGVVLAIWSLVISLGKPVGKGLWHVATSPLLRRTRSRAWGLTGGAVALSGIVLFVLPLPQTTWTQGVVRAPEGADIIAPAEGEIAAAKADMGTRVATGDPLLVLLDPRSDARATALSARLREAELDRTRATLEGPGEQRLASIAVEDARAALVRETVRIAERTIAAGVTGVFQPIAPAQDLVGRHVRRGDLLGHVLPGTADRVRLVALQGQVAAIERGVRRAEVRLPHDPTIWPVTLEGRVSTGAFDLPSPILARSAGGPVPAAPGETGLQATERVFTYDAVLPDGLDAPIGGRVHVKLVHPWRTLGPRLYEAARRALSGRIEL